MLLLRDVAGREHAVEHHVAALLAGLRVLLRVEVRRRLGDAHKGGSLRQRQVERRHLEVVLCRRLYAVAAVAVVDGVQVHEEYLVFGVHLLHVHRQLRFADLALERDVVGLLGQHGVAHELLRDGGGALERPAAQVDEHGACDAGKVHAGMLVEAHVLGVHRALEHVGAHLVGRGERVPLLKLELGQKRALVARVHRRLLRVVERVGARQAGEVARPIVYDVKHALDALIRHEAESRCCDKQEPFRGMGARFALFSPYFHGSTILPYCRCRTVTTRAGAQKRA